MRKTSLFLLLASAPLLSGCAGIVIGAAATAGYFTVQERGAQQALEDSKITTHIRDRLASANYHFITDIGVTVLNKHVLLTGVTTSETDAERVNNIAKSTPGVTVVYNELMVGSKGDLKEGAQDAAIATQLRTKLLTADGVYSVNYMVDVVLGHVYMTGLAQTEEEKARALHVARTVKGVKQVHDYIQVSVATPKSMLGDAVEREAPNPQPMDNN